MDKINITHYPVHYLFGELGSPFGSLLYITILHIILNLTSRLLLDKKEYHTNFFLYIITGTELGYYYVIFGVLIIIKNRLVIVKTPHIKHNTY